MEDAFIDDAIIKIIKGKFKKLPVKGTTTGITVEKSKRDGYLGSFAEKSIAELEDLLARQKKILENKSFISKLKDGGKKLKILYEEIQEALQNAKSIKNNDCKLINIEEFEWRAGKEIDDDDEEDTVCDPLYLMATHSRTIPTKLPPVKEDDPSAIISKEMEKLSIQGENNCNGDASSRVISDENSFSAQKWYTNCKSKMLTELNVNPEKNIKRKQFKTNRNFEGAVPHQLRSHKNTSLWMESSATGPVNPTSSTEVHLMSLKESYDLYQISKQNDTIRYLKQAELSLKSPLTGCLTYRDVNLTKHIIRPKEDDDTFYREND